MDRLDEVLQFDSLLEAEKVTGKSYKEDDFTTSLGLLLHLDNTEERIHLLTETDDTTFTNELVNYQRIIEDIGFERVFEQPFFSSNWKQQEKEFIYFHRLYGLLLHFDTFNGNDVNSGKFYYNWRPFGGEWVATEKDYYGTSYIEPEWNGEWNWEGARSSGSWHWSVDVKNAPIGSVIDATWIGDHDCREAVRRKIARLQECGEFVVPWVEAPYLQLVNYAEWRENIDSREVTRQKYEQLPDFVKDVVGELR